MSAFSISNFGFISIIASNIRIDVLSFQYAWTQSQISQEEPLQMYQIK